MKYNPYKYQIRAAEWVMDRRRCCLFLDCGLGKSVITLTAFSDLQDACEVETMLVVAPKKVAETTWTTECEKWDHLRNLRVSRVMGDERHRIAALEEKADIYVIGRDSFVWMVDHFKGRMPFDMLVIDELTSFKTPRSKRFKAMRSVTPQFSRVVGLTGTPAPNGLIDLWAQMYCIDMGKRLGKSVTRYRDEYFSVFRWNNIVIRCTPKKGMEEAIHKKIADICLSMQAKDYLELPDLIVNDVPVGLPDKTMSAYQTFEREQVLQFVEEHSEEDVSIIAGSAAALMNKLSQYANGAIYDQDRNVFEIHDEKLQVLREIVEQVTSGGVLVFYQYKHDITRIQKALKDYSPVVYENEAQLEKWNSGKIKVLLAHSASTAYGLNMQYGGHTIVWFGIGWNLELYQQANARLHRQGQSHPVIAHRLITSGTVDERMAAALQQKKGTQQALLDLLGDMIRDYGKQGCTG